MLTILMILLLLAAAVLLIAYICFRMAFYSDRRPDPNAEEYSIPKGEIYEPFREQMVQWIKEVRAMPHEDVSIQSFDGLTLRGKYYECTPGAPIELMFHGYRGNSERDMGGGVQRCFALGRSALIVDQRACGRSDGTVITFGVKESRDCLSWLDFMQQRFGPDVKIILTGISMGASTVLNASGYPLPPNVIGVLADCGFDSPRNIMYKVIKEDMHLPPKLAYPFVRLGAMLFGRFDPDSVTSINSVKNATVPVIFFHGGADAFVPKEMSQANYDACPTRKKLVIIPDAGHGLSFPVDQEGYLQALREFFPAYTHSVVS